jgi:hypothetical protein
MNIPIKISLKNAAEKVSTVMDDELHQLVLEGQVSFKDAIKALKDAGQALDKSVYPWLQYVENWATGEFDKEPASAKPAAKPDLLSAKAEKKVAAQQPEAVVAEDPKPEPETNPEGAD